MRSAMSHNGIAPRFCGQCGWALEEPLHEGCALRSALEPPRYCAYCARRMVVQVTPSRWRALCSRHGAFTSPGSSHLEGDDEALG